MCLKLHTFLQQKLKQLRENENQKDRFQKTDQICSLCSKETTLILLVPNYLLISDLNFQ